MCIIGTRLILKIKHVYNKKMPSYFIAHKTLSDSLARKIFAWDNGELVFADTSSLIKGLTATGIIDKSGAAYLRLSWDNEAGIETYSLGYDSKQDLAISVKPAQEGKYTGFSIYAFSGKSQDAADESLSKFMTAVTNTYLGTSRRKLRRKTQRHYPKSKKSRHHI